MLFAAAAPLLSQAHAVITGNTGKNGLGIFLGWLLLGVVAAVIGIICAFVGATQLPRTRLTHIALIVAVIETVVLAIGVFQMF